MSIFETTLGTKGSDVYTTDGVGNTLVALSALLTRGADKTLVQNLLLKSLRLNTEDSEKDCFVLAFMTRAVRGGKGERELFYDLYSVLLKEREALALDLLDLVGDYGYWNDLFTLWEKFANSKAFETRAIEIVSKQLKADEVALISGGKVSLLSKWMPRESSHTHGYKIVKVLVDSLYTVSCGNKYGEGIQSQKFASYRKRLATLNAHIKTTEIAMCSKNWKNIIPSSVPGRCLSKNRLAFLNELASTKKDGHPPRGQLRHPDDKDRMLCREKFQKHFTKTAKGEVISKGADTLFPHEVIDKLCNYPSSDELNALTGMWKAFVAKAQEGGGLGRSIAMCDFSGSMNGLPIAVSRAMGLLISEVTTNEFKDRMLTFDSTPQWLTFPTESSIVERINLVNTSGYGQGLSTDFQAAMDLILSELKTKRVIPGKEPENLIVLTDMAWDAACGSSDISGYTGNMYRHVVKTAPWQTQIQMIRESFKRAGEDLFGEGNGYNPPRIVIWNISATCHDAHAKASEEGVVMLSGWSPSLFKVLMTKGVEIQTPEQALRVQLDDPNYNLVRERIDSFRKREK